MSWRHHLAVAVEQVGPGARHGVGGGGLEARRSLPGQAEPDQLAVDEAVDAQEGEADQAQPEAALVEPRRADVAHEGAGAGDAARCGRARRRPVGGLGRGIGETGHAGAISRKTGSRRSRRRVLSPGVAVGSPRPSESSLRPIESTLGGGSGRSVGLDDLVQRQFLQAEPLVGQARQPVGPGQDGPFGLEPLDAVLFGGDVVARLEDLFGVEDRLVFHRIGVDRRADQDRDRQDIEQAQHGSGPPAGREGGAIRPGYRDGGPRRGIGRPGRCIGAGPAPAAWPSGRAGWRRLPRPTARRAACRAARSSAAGARRAGRQVARAALAAAGAPLEEALDDAVLERMEA